MKALTHTLNEREKLPKPFRVWKCGYCKNVFATQCPFKSESCDGKFPRCCPYCGQHPETIHHYEDV